MSKSSRQPVTVASVPRKATTACFLPENSQQNTAAANCLSFSGSKLDTNLSSLTPEKRGYDSSMLHRSYLGLKPSTENGMSPLHAT